MIFDAVPYSVVRAGKNGPTSNYIRSFLDFLERKLGARVLFDLRQIPYDGDATMRGSFQLAQALVEKNIIRSFFRVKIPDDEPQLFMWSCIGTDEQETISGGAAWNNDNAALTAALAESIERHVWLTRTDYFSSPVIENTQKIGRRGDFIDPERFVAYSPKQRSQDTKHLSIRKEQEFLWIRAHSLVSGTPVYIPAQIVSAAHNAVDVGTEPVIRWRTTNGLATWPTLSGARLRGALEIIERDAYMITWFNQLTLPRIDMRSLKGTRRSLDELLKSCERYRLKVHAIRMLTDAPTHAVCVALEDMSEIAPRFGIGLKARPSLPEAVEGALTEALRGRWSYRRHFDNGGFWNEATPIDQIGHKERLYYWGMPEHAKKLEFLVQGEEIPYNFDAQWEHDSSDEHLERIIQWCREKKYEYASVSLGASTSNPTRWHIEMTVIPELHPAHLTEERRNLDTKRLKEVPSLFGYPPRSEPFIGAPHPFC